MGQFMMEWLQDMWYLNWSIETDYHYVIKYGEPLPRGHKARRKALEALVKAYRKNFL